jgi:hypothetical protein
MSTFIPSIGPVCAVATITKVFSIKAAKPAKVYPWVAANHG